MRSSQRDSTARGLSYERLAADWLRGYGLIVDYDPTHTRHRPDLTVRGYSITISREDGSVVATRAWTCDPPIRIEVKGSKWHRINQRGYGYQYCLNRVRLSLPIAEEFVILVAVQDRKRVYFLIPNSVAMGIHKISLHCLSAESYLGKYAIYRDDVRPIIDEVIRQATGGMGSFAHDQTSASIQVRSDPSPASETTLA